MNFETEIIKWLKIYKRSELKRTSYDTLEKTIRLYLIPKFKDYELQNINSDEIMEMLNDLTFSSYAHSTIKKVYDTLNSFLKYAVQKDLIMKNPTIVVKPPSKKNNQPKQMNFWDSNTIEKFEREATRKYYNGKYVYHNGYAYIMMLHTGIRMGEMLALDRNTDYNAENHTIKIHSDVEQVNKRDKNYNIIRGYTVIKQNSPKTVTSNREIQLNKTAQKCIEILLRNNKNSDFIVSTLDGKMLPPQHFQKTFYRILKNAGIKKVGIHTLRHTFASNMFKNGVNVKIVSKILGHASVRITYDTYIHLLETEVYDAVFCLDNKQI